MQLNAVVVTRAAAWACLIRLVSSSPTIGFPVNAQVPPVARISQTFSFVFAENTFISSTLSSLTYSLDSSPSWLSIDSGERWLHGTPEDSDVASGEVVGVPFGLIATDDSGSTTLNVTLVVSRNAAPAVEIPITEQLAMSGLAYSEPSSILSYPSTYFNFTFSQSTFSSSGLNYYAVSGDNSPLPSWIAFDSGQLMFSGTTPPADSLIEPPETFNFQLVASDVTGFGAASVAFSIVVGSREITADEPAVVLNATVGKELVYDGLQQGIKIDGQDAGPSNLTAKVLPGASPPDWLTFNADTWELSGTPPSSAQNAAFAISFSDSLSDSVNVTFQVDIDDNGTVFRDTLPAMQVQRGSAFYLDLEQYLIQTDGVEIVVDSEPKQDWITFNDTSHTVSGDVPIGETDSSVSVSVRATLESSKATESETFLLQIMGSSSNSSSTSSAASSITPTSTPTTSAAAASMKETTSKKTILMAVLIPTMLLAFALIIIACCMCSRRRRKRRELSQSLTNKDISDPVPFSFAYNGQDDMVSSMRALDKEYKVNNLNAYAQQQKDIQENEKLGAADMPVGTALTLSLGDEFNTGQGKERTLAEMTEADGGATIGDGIPDFPAPPSLNHRPGQSVSPSSSTTGTGGSAQALAAVTSNSQWPFEESTLKSSEHSRNSSHTDDESVVSYLAGSDHQDALGIYGSANSGSRSGPGSSQSNQNSASVITRQRVRTSTPLQMDVLSQVDKDASGSGTGGLRSEHIFTSQEAIVHDGQSTTAGTIVHHDDSHMGDRGSVQFVVGGSRSTVHDHHSAMEAGIGADGQNVGAQRRGFLSGFASRIANRFKKSTPASSRSRPANNRLSSIAASGYPSPDAPSFDTDIGSVTISNITTAQPHKPRPVFIGSVNRITEESPQPNGTPWNRENTNGWAAGAAAGAAAAAGAQASRRSQQQGHYRRQQGYNQMHDGADDGDDDDYEDIDGETDIDGSDVDIDEAIRLDPPRPAFLPLSNADRDATDLSQDIASSLRSRRPTSKSSGMSGISAAMEEVRSLLLLPSDSPSMSDGRGSHQYTGGAASESGTYPPSSNSWETLSDEPNWTSLFEYRVPGQQSPAVARTTTATDAGSNEPPTPATGVSLPYNAGVFASRPQPQQQHATGSPGSAAQHQAQAQAHARAQARAQEARGFQPVQIHPTGASSTAAGSSPHTPAGGVTPETPVFKAQHSTINVINNNTNIDNVRNNDDTDLALSGRGYRHTSSYYPDDQDHHLQDQAFAMTTNDYEYPPPFVASGNAYHHHMAAAAAAAAASSAGATRAVPTTPEIRSASSDDVGSPMDMTEDQAAGSVPSIGLAVSKYSQSQLATQSSLVSTASSGIRAFI